MFGRVNLNKRFLGIFERHRRCGRAAPLMAFTSTALLGAMAPAVVSAEELAPPAVRFALVQTGSLEGRVDALQVAATDIGARLAGAFPLPPARVDVTDERVQVAQSSRDIGSLNVRIGHLEEQFRILNGQVEGLQFQMTQLQTLIERMQEDNEFRFQALEGGGLGKTRAAPQSDGVMPLGGVPQPLDTDAPIELGGVETIIDPGTDEDFTMGGVEQGLGSLPSGALALPPGQPLDILQTAEGLITDADADAQYRAGYDAVVRGEYEFAEEQFRQFIALFPEHQSVPDATNWLGEALLQRGEYDAAADILLTGFQNYPNSTRASDMLLKLGMALAGAGEMDTACRTFSEVLRRYPSRPAVFKERLIAESAKAQC